MKIELQDVEPCVKKIKIEVPVEKVDEEKSAIYREISKTATIPGFRKGRAPRSVLERMYSKSVLGDAAQRIIQAAYREAIEKNDLKPIGDPIVDDISVEDSKPLSFTATVEVFPEVSLKDVSDIKLTRKIHKASDKEIDNVLEQYRERQARFEPVEGRTVEDGDFVFMDYSASHNGQPVKNFEGKNRQVHVSSENMLAGFHEGVLGVAKGEEKEFEAELPKEFPDPELAGAKVTFHVKVNEIKKKILPDIDDQLAKEVSEFDTLDELKEDIRKKLEERNRSAADNTLRDELLTKLIEDNPIDLAPSLVERQTEAVAERTERNFKSQGIDLRQAGLDDVGIKERSREEAVRMLKEQAIVSAFGKAEGIQVTEADIDAEIEKIANMMGQPVEVTKNQLSNADSVSGLAHQAFTDKVYAAIMDKITIEDETVEDIDEN